MLTILVAKRLQLVATRSLDDTVLIALNRLISYALSDTLRALPAKSLETLGQMGVREVVAGVDGVGVHGAEVLDLELEKRAGELLGVAEALGEGVGLELELAGEDVHAQLEEDVHGGEGVGEEEEADDDWVLGEEAEGGVQGVVVDEDREESEDVENVGLENNVRLAVDGEHGDGSYLRDAEKAGGVAKLPVTEFVSKDSDDLFRLTLLNKSIVDDNVLLPGETKEIGVGVGASLASINDVELVKRELEAGGKSLDLGLELALLERGELVEQRQDSNGVDSNHEDLEAGGESPEVEEELVAGLLDDLEETGQDGRSENEGQELRLENIGNKELGSLLVEAKLLLEDKSVVDGARKTQDLTDDQETQDEDNRMANLAGEARGRPPEDQVARPRPQLRQDIKLDKGDILDLAPQAVEDLKLGLGTTVGLGLVKDLLGDLLGEHGGGAGLLQDAVLAGREEGFEEVLADGEADDELLPGEEGTVEEARETLGEEKS